MRLEHRRERTGVRERSADGRSARVDRSTGDSVEAADDADELSLDPDRGVELWRVVRVGGLEADPILLAEESLQGDGVLLDLGDDDVAVASGLLRSDDDEVTVRDMRLDHRVAADPQHIRIARRRE